MRIEIFALLDAFLERGALATIGDARKECKKKKHRKRYCQDLRANKVRCCLKKRWRKASKPQTEPRCLYSRVFAVALLARAPDGCLLRYVCVPASPCPPLRHEPEGRAGPTRKS